MNHQDPFVLFTITLDQNSRSPKQVHQEKQTRRTVNKLTASAGNLHTSRSPQICNGKALTKGNQVVLVNGKPHRLIQIKSIAGNIFKISHQLRISLKENTFSFFALTIAQEDVDIRQHRKNLIENQGKEGGLSKIPDRIFQVGDREIIFLIKIKLDFFRNIWRLTGLLDKLYDFFFFWGKHFVCPELSTAGLAACQHFSRAS